MSEVRQWWEVPEPDPTAPRHTVWTRIRQVLERLCATVPELRHWDLDVTAEHEETGRRQLSRVHFTFVNTLAPSWSNSALARSRPAAIDRPAPAQPDEAPALPASEPS